MPLRSGVKTKIAKRRYRRGGVVGKRLCGGAARHHRIVWIRCLAAGTLVARPDGFVRCRRSLAVTKTV
jgi:hypothetical protein